VFQKGDTLMSKTKFLDSSRTQFERRAFWSQHIAGWKRSGLRLIDYCRNNQLNTSTFSYWRVKLEASSPNSKERKSDSQGPCCSLVQVPEHLFLPDQQLSNPSAGLVIQVCEGRFQVDIRKDFPVSLLAKVVKTLESLTGQN